MSMWSSAAKAAVGLWENGGAAKAAALQSSFKGGLKAFDPGHTLKGLGFQAAASLLVPGSPEAKLESMKLGTAMWFLTMGMKNPGRQNFWFTMATLAPQSGQMLRGVVQQYHSVEQSRTSAAIPFSHSTMAMDQAMMTLQYAQGRMNGAYAGLGAQASMYAAKYMQR